MPDPKPWLYFGLELRVVGDDHARKRPIVIDAERPCTYRPDWQWDLMASLGFVGGPIYCASKSSIAPGDEAHVVIIPAAPQSLLIWALLNVGDELRMHEGSRVVGHATVLMSGRTLLPVPDADERRFHAWANATKSDP
jgi:hypothetical protein